MTMKRFSAGLIALAACMVSAEAAAATYFGLSVGQSTLDDWDSSVIDDGSFGSISAEDSDVGFRIMGGNELNENFAIEFGYSDFGEATADGTSDGSGFFWAPGPVSGRASADGFDLGVVARAPTSESFALFARIGMLIWDSKYDLHDSGGNSINGTDDGSDLFFGIGGEFKTTGALAMRGEFTKYSLDDSDITAIAFSLIYRMQ